MSTTNQRRLSLPELRDLLADHERLRARITNHYNPQSLLDVMTVEWDGEPGHDWFCDDEARLHCRIEELGFAPVTTASIRRALRLLPHTEEHHQTTGHTWMHS